MKRSYFILFFILLILNSCIDTKPFRVGDNLDYTWHISNISSTDSKLDDAASYICNLRSTLRQLAVGYFTSRDFNNPYESKILAIKLQNKLKKQCGIISELIDTYQYIDFKNFDVIIKKPSKNYSFMVYGNYTYFNKGYNLNIIVYRLQDLKILEILRYRIPVHNLNIDINKIEIPREINLQ